MKKLLSVFAIATLVFLTSALPPVRQWVDNIWIKGSLGVQYNPNVSPYTLHVLGTTGRPGSYISDDDSTCTFTLSDSTIVLKASEGVNMDSTTFQEYKGANVASASVITLPPGNFFDLTGTTTVNRVVVTDKQAGYRFTLQANGSVTIADSSVTGAAAGNVMFRTKSGSNLTMSANDICDFVYDGTVVWQAAELIALEN